MLDELIPVYGATGYVRERIGSATEYVVPHNHYRARDGRWVAIACTNDRMFERLATAMDRPELAREFPTMASRLARRAELDAIVQAWVGAADGQDVLARLDAAEVPCGSVASARDLFDDPQVRARENIVEIAESARRVCSRWSASCPRLAAHARSHRHDRTRRGRRPQPGDLLRAPRPQPRRGRRRSLDAA